MDNNKIAVILPVYKNDIDKYLVLSIDSILNQTYENIHLFIGVDGPVGDDLRNTLLQYEKLTKVSILWFKENRGLPIVLNDLLDVCFKEEYKYIARMDADDISRPDRIKKQYQYLLDNPTIDVISGATHQIDKDGNSRGFTIYRHQDPEDCKKQFAFENPLSHPATMFRKSFFDKAGCKYREDHRINQDTLLWYDGLMNGVIISNVPDVVLDFRSTDDMFTKRRGGFQKAKKQLKDRLMINKGLHYGLKANLYAVGVFIMMISPGFVRKMAYNILKK